LTIVQRTAIAEAVDDDDELDQIRERLAKVRS
jgi:hypothetical protein